MLKRRTFLMSLSTIVSAPILSCVKHVRSLVISLASASETRKESPRRENAAVGQLKAQTLNTLMSTTQTLLDVPIETDHYEAFFLSRTENEPGYQRLYERFSKTIDRLARRYTSSDFINCDLDIRRQILNQIARLRQENIELLFFHDRVILEILTLFARTDVWILLGYESWPGVPSGLATYTKAAENENNRTNTKKAHRYD